MIEEAGGANKHWTLLSTAGYAEREFLGNNKGYRAAAEAHMLTSFGRLLGLSDDGECTSVRPPMMTPLSSVPPRMSTGSQRRICAGLDVKCAEL